MLEPLKITNHMLMQRSSIFKTLYKHASLVPWNHTRSPSCSRNASSTLRLFVVGCLGVGVNPGDVANGSGHK